MVIPIKILLCEDSKTQRLRLHRSLLSAFRGLEGGIEVTECSTLSDCISFSIGHDVIMLDLDLGKSASKEETLKQIHEFAPVPVVVVTNHRDAETIQDCIEKYGASDYIYKPTAFKDHRVLMLRLCSAIWRARFQNKIRNARV